VIPFDRAQDGLRQGSGQADWRADLLRFWFGLGKEQWWKGTPELDEQIRRRFLETWAEQRQLPVDAFLGDPLTALAGVILFDQVPRNIFRGSAEQYATDHLALAIAQAAVGRGFDDQLGAEERGFLYMPFQHSEDPADQKRSLQLFTALGEHDMLHYAKLHHDIVERFGRFPHRNRVLGRKPRADEVAAGNPVPW
jgi:uncharacterized protein (DUF924 family)